jgi:hypothetical protein
MLMAEELFSATDVEPLSMIVDIQIVRGIAKQKREASSSY